MSIRTPRVPGQTSISQLLILGLLDDTDVNCDGTVSEYARVLAERRYADIHYTRTTRPSTAHPLRQSRIHVQRPSTSINVQRPTTSINVHIGTTSSHIFRVKCLKKMSEEEVDSLTNLEKRQFKLDACCICYGRARTHAFVPCFHLCVCEDCGARLNQCPMCREPANSIQKIYV